MSTVRIGPNRQVTLPQDVLEQMDLGAGDALEAEVREGKPVLTPKSADTLDPEERKLLQHAKGKIARIRNDMARSRGLTPVEADLAPRTGPKDQRWWWTETWQGGERQADLKAGRVKIFENADELLKDLRKRGSGEARTYRALRARFPIASASDPAKSRQTASVAH